MKNLRDGFLYEHLPKVSKLMDEEIEKNISIDDFPAELDQKIYALIERGAKKRCRIPMSAIVLSFVVSITTITVAADAATGGKIYAVIKEFFGAEEITDENRNMIGAEIVDETSLGDPLYEKDWGKEITCAPEVLSPASFDGFAVKEGKTPEIILLNGACALFCKGDYDEWNLKKGDTLTFEFEKYPTHSGISQTVFVGYILNGVMYEGEPFDEINGCYQLYAKEDGEYYIYVISATSDPVTLKEGKIY